MNAGKPDNQRLLRWQIARAVAIACGTTALATPVFGDQALEEVIITAQKREQDIQSVPITVNVLTSTQLTNLGVKTFEDYAQLLPNVSYSETQPSRAEIYIRGISSGGNSELGGASNVAVYLDEQPITTASTYLNPHIYDIDRIEVLAGPQGTLFGANAQSGAIRIISKKPDKSKFAAGYDLEGNQVSHGDAGYVVQGYVNFPLVQNRAAVRLVGWDERDAGYIDNIATTHVFKQAFLGQPDITVNNAPIVKDNFNVATTKGGRAALDFDLGENWTTTAMVLRQELKTTGVWDYNPALGDLKVARLLPEKESDDFTQSSLTLTGKLGKTTLTYTGAHLDRHYLQDLDYSLYSDYYIAGSFVQAYYTCYVSYFGACVDPRMLATGNEKTSRTNHELRLASASDQRFRWLIGGFYEQSKWASDLDFRIPGIASISHFDAKGIRIDGPAVQPPDVYFTTNVVKNTDERAFFGQIEYDFTNKLTGSFSARKFKYNAHVLGFTGTIFYPVCKPVSCNDPTRPNVDLHSTDDDHVIRANLSYKPSKDVMWFTTYSEGYRPGGANRAFGTTVPTYKADFLKSIELGAKTTLLDGHLRLNGAIYFQNWDNFQLSRVDTSVSPITLTYNIGAATSNGIEGDFTYLFQHNWEISGAASYDKAELSKDYWKSSVSQAAGNPPDVAKGTELPRVPKTKWNIRIRYNTDMMGRPMYLQATNSYTGSSFSQFINTAKEKRQTQASYDVVNLAWGFEGKTWSGELFLGNATDERGEVYRNDNSWDNRITTNRPRTIGIRFRQRF
jgi:outer membrane receptor protein involved in Fe transport